jgi:hypothetical protein
MDTIKELAPKGAFDGLEKGLWWPLKGPEARPDLEELQQAFKKAAALHLARPFPLELPQVDRDVFMANPTSRELTAQNSPL